MTSSVLNGGNFSGGFKAWLKAAPVNFLSAGIANDIGHGNIKELIGGSDGARALAHGISGGVFGVAGGGDFASGFASSLVGGYTENTHNFALTVLASGSAAALTGGKFGDGAMRGAFVYMYNLMGNPMADIADRVAGVGSGPYTPGAGTSGCNRIDSLVPEVEEGTPSLIGILSKINSRLTGAFSLKQPPQSAFSRGWQAQDRWWQEFNNAGAVSLYHDNFRSYELRHNDPGAYTGGAGGFPYKGLNSGNSIHGPFYD
jgi:hypothetical protein